MSKLPEKCPVCGEKMEKGYLHSRSSFQWSKERKRFTDGVERVVPQGPYMFGATSIGAYRCPNCKIVLFSYGEEQEKK